MSLSASAPTILIVDDTPVNVMMLESVLDAEGFRTITAPDGVRARERASADVPGSDPAGRYDARRVGI